MLSRGGIKGIFSKALIGLPIETKKLQIIAAFFMLLALAYPSPKYPYFGCVSVSRLQI